MGIDGLFLALLDSSLLALISSPIIFFLIIRPYVEIITKRELELHHLASHDHLTGLLNRRVMLLELKSVVERCKRMNYFGALFYLDLDDFKPINDEHGHDVGDAVLCHIAEKINEVTRVNDLCARIGGDEFIIIFPFLTQDESRLPEVVAILANKISTSIKSIESYPEIEALQVSIGIAFFPHKEGEESLIKKADQAMYVAKKRNKTYYFTSLLPSR